MNHRLSHALEFISRKVPKPKKQPSLGVYLIKCENFYKIGITSSVWKRLATIRTGMPFRIELVKFWHCKNARQQERKLHGMLWRYHVRGEWFELPISIVLAFGVGDQDRMKAVALAIKDCSPRQRKQS